MNPDRDNSYRFRVTPGQVVTLNRDVTGVIWDTTTDDWKVVGRPVAPAGSQVTVLAESNAGFRGIEFSFEYNGQRFWHHVTTSAIAEYG